MLHFVPATIVATAAFAEDEWYWRPAVAEINDKLPPEVRVFDCTRVAKSFEARFGCAARTYEFLMPASALGICGDGHDGDAVLPLASPPHSFIGLDIEFMPENLCSSTSASA
ncbi:hypothetical protein CYMTET_12981 [Cymbomonas tetramitiformis]|uniref:Uncharacterized protein n=1 Tax=Cymbomonas tetramitiformis TaxID=36881 RepID=A0AAE0GJD5_9CHLO|nr:hypothetical protein CYMTET_12981 [Cymbomonas tetramitiformis]